MEGRVLERSSPLAGTWEEEPEGTDAGCGLVRMAEKELTRKRVVMTMQKDLW